MTTYLYGLVLNRSAHLVPAHIRGLHARPLRVISCESAGLSALVSTLDRSPERANLDDIRAHDHALQSVVQHGSTTVAVRFGETFASESEVQRHVAERAERIERVLEEFDGCVEMRVLLPMESEPQNEDAPADASGPGRAYLERLRERGPRIRDVTLRDALGPIVRAEKVEQLAVGRGAVFAHLVARADEAAYRAAIAQLPALKEARVAGPLAFYSFAEPNT